MLGINRGRWSRRLAGGIYYAILVEAFLLALSPLAATCALVLGVVLWLLRLCIAKRARHFRHLPLDVPAALFVLISAFSILASPDKMFSFYNWYHLIGAYALTYLLVGQNIERKGEIREIIYALGLSLVISLLYGFWQFAFGIEAGDVKWVDPQAFPELKQRIFSTWENPNIFAGYLDMMIALAFSFLLRLKDKRSRWLLAGLLVALFAALALTYARGAFLAVGIVLLLYGMFRDWRVLLGGGMLFFGALYLDPALLTRITSVFTQIDTSMEMREALWVSTLAMIGDHPFMGIGWGAYYMVYPNYDFYLQGAPVLIVHAHNLYLNYAAEIGIIGALAFLWFFFGSAFLAFFSKAHDDAGFSQGLLLGIALAFFTVALNGLTDDLLFNFPSSLLLWLLAALAACADIAPAEGIYFGTIAPPLDKFARLRAAYRRARMLGRKTLPKRVPSTKEDEDGEDKGDKRS